MLEFLSYHIISLIIVGIILLMIFVNYYGGKKNKQIAEKYKAIIAPFIGSTFRKFDGELVFESANIAKMYPSDRDSCMFAIISFALVPRQQILSFFLNPIIFKLKDELVLEVPINIEIPISMTGAIVRRKQIRSTITKKKFPDVKQLCKEYKPVIRN